jgi:hypothetical protein
MNSRYDAIKKHLKGRPLYGNILTRVEQQRAKRKEEGRDRFLVGGKLVWAGGIKERDWSADVNQYKASPAQSI